MSDIITEKNFENQTENAPARIVKFTNFSDEDFTWTWNKVPYTFRKGGVKFMETGIAHHFAKHLINRELLKRGRESDTSPKKPEENPFFMELYNQCIEPVADTGEMDATKSEQEIIDRNMKEKMGIKDAPEVESPKPSIPASKPTAKKPSKSSKAKKEEEEIEIEEGPADDDE